MTKINDVIELNGKRYHARTGAFLGDLSATTTAAPAAQPARQAASHIPAHRPQPTRTLMRRAVAAPQASIAKPHIKPQAPVQPAAVVHHGAIKAKLSANNVDSHRSQRATTVDRSRLVRRFQNNQPAATVVAAAQAPKPLVTVPQHPTAHARPVAVHTDLTAAKPIKPAHQPTFNAAPHPAQARPQHLRTSLRRTQPTPAPMAAASHPATRAATPAVHYKAAVNDDPEEQDIFERALAMATSHEQQPPKQSMLKSAKRRKRARRLVSLAAGMAVFVLLAGFIAYQNKASIQMQMASAKAGFAATDPVYKPTGYSMGKLAYEQGSVTTMYNKADKSFSIVQKQSNWDSQTLLENFVATTNEDYQGYESNGRTIYLYGNGKATWVDGGIWYQINAGNVLPTDQLVKVAASM